jgi:hypothetical protein
MAYDSARGVTVLFGGNPGFVASSETWEWNGIAWSQRRVSGPPARGYHAMAYDSARRVTVLFGGSDNDGNNLRDTWEWNGSAWTRRSTTGPSARSSHAMIFDAARGVTVLFGGTTNQGSTNAETWEWNGTTWTRRTGTGPSRRFLHAMAYDSERGATVLFGGNTPPANPETWELRAACVAPSITAQPMPQSACRAGNAALTVATSGTGPFTYQWRKNSVEIDATANPSAATATLQLSSLGVLDAASYDCVVRNSCGEVTTQHAALEICAADYNCDGFLDFFDYSDFVECFETGGCGGGADFNADGFVDFFDYADFVTAFEAGC